MSTEINIESVKQWANTIYKLETEKPLYNIFAGWNLNENDHSKILLALLGYYDDSDCYPILHSFIRRFAKTIIVQKGEVKSVKLEFNASTKPKSRKVRYIDGLITFEVNGCKYAFILENKIYYACDQQDQVRDYIKHVKNNLGVNKDLIWVFYLPGDSSKTVSADSYNTECERDDSNIGDRFVSLSYSDDILAWLKEDVLKSRVYPESIISIARVYVDYLDNDLFNPDKELNKQKALLGLLYGDDVEDWNDLKENEIPQLYNLNDLISKQRKNDKEIIPNKDAIEALYRTNLSIIRRVENFAFDQLEKVSVDVLNNNFQNEQPWRAKRTINRKTGKGYLQIRIVDEANTCHLEWIPISAESMLHEHQYTIAIHVEGNNQKMQDLKREAEQIFDRLVLVIDSTVPLATMNYAELYSFLNELYTNKIKDWVRFLIDKKDRY